MHEAGMVGVTLQTWHSHPVASYIARHLVLNHQNIRFRLHLMNFKESNNMHNYINKSGGMVDTTPQNVWGCYIL